MKSVLLSLLTLFVCSMPALATLSGSDVKEVRGKLEDFEKGRLTLEECTEHGGEEWALKLVNYYLANTNSVTVKMKLPISRCFAAGGDYLKALPLATGYLNTYSNDWRGWRIMGGCYMELGDFSKAISAYTNAVRCGDEWSCIPATFSALKSDQLNSVEHIIPDLLRFKSSTQTPRGEMLDALKALVAYSLKADRPDVFTNALSGPRIDIDKSQEDLRDLILTGCKKFKAVDLEKLYK